MSLNLICTQLWYFDGKNHYIIQNINNINNINIELIFFESFLRKRNFPTFNFQEIHGNSDHRPTFQVINGGSHAGNGLPVQDRGGGW